MLAPAGGFVLAGTIEEVLAMGDGVDAVIICTPNFAHKDAVIACVAAGKHVMCEKPLALSSAEAYAMVDAANDAVRREHVQVDTLRRVTVGRRDVAPSCRPETPVRVWVGGRFGVL